MLVQCPHCGKSVVVNGLGRRSLNITVIKVCDALRLYLSVPVAAEKLMCSRGLIYKILKMNGLTVQGAIKEQLNDGK